MKVTFPKNIKKGFFSGFMITIGPLSVSVIQLVLVAIGIALALAAFNAASKVGSKSFGIILAIIVIILTLFVTFFKVSEMNVVQLVAKKIKENFFDVTKKYQSNMEKLDPIEISLKEGEVQDTKQQVVEQKEEPDVEEILHEIKKDELI